jgi:hypothetical protein
VPNKLLISQEKVINQKALGFVRIVLLISPKNLPFNLLLVQEEQYSQHDEFEETYQQFEC